MIDLFSLALAHGLLLLMALRLLGRADLDRDAPPNPHGTDEGHEP